MFLKLAFAFVMHCLMLHCFRFVFHILGNYMYNRFKIENQVEDQMMYWVSEEFYLSFVVTPVCLCHLSLLANSDGLSKVCAVVGIGS